MFVEDSPKTYAVSNQWPCNSFQILFWNDPIRALYSQGTQLQEPPCHQGRQDNRSSQNSLLEAEKND